MQEQYMSRQDFDAAQYGASMLRSMLIGHTDTLYAAWEASGRDPLAVWSALRLVVEMLHEFPDVVQNSMTSKLSRFMMMQAANVDRLVPNDDGDVC